MWSNYLALTSPIRFAELTHALEEKVCDLHVEVHGTFLNNLVFSDIRCVSDKPDEWQCTNLRQKIYCTFPSRFIAHND